MLFFALLFAGMIFLRKLYLQRSEALQFSISCVAFLALVVLMISEYPWKSNGPVILIFFVCVIGLTDSFKSWQRSLSS